MEEERMKRKLENEDENEEQKMEKFFALIKRTKDVRDLFFKEKSDEGIKKTEGGIWNPTFQPEDFINCRELVKSNISGPDQVAGPSNKEQELIENKECLQEATTVVPVAENNEEKEKDKTSEHLDLNLSL